MITVLAGTPCDPCIRANLLLIFLLLLLLLILVSWPSFMRHCILSSIETRFLRPQQYASFFTPLLLSWTTMRRGTNTKRFVFPWPWVCKVQWVTARGVLSARIPVLWQVNFDETDLPDKHFHLFDEDMEHADYSQREAALAAPPWRSSLLYHQIPSLFYVCVWACIHLFTRPLGNNVTFGSILGTQQKLMTLLSKRMFVGPLSVDDREVAVRTSSHLPPFWRIHRTLLYFYGVHWPVFLTFLFHESSRNKGNSSKCYLKCRVYCLLLSSSFSSSWHAKNWKWWVVGVGFEFFLRPGDLRWRHLRRTGIECCSRRR